MAGDLDPSTLRPTPASPSDNAGIPDDVRAALTAAHQNELATQTQSTGYGASLPGAFETGRSIATSGVKKAFDAAGAIDTALGLKTPAQAESRADAYSKFLVPQTGGELLARSAGLVPGAGIGAALLRIGLAASGGAVGNELTGYDPRTGAVSGAIGQGIGEGVAGVTGSIASHRFRANLANPNKPFSDSVLVPAAIASEVPAFAHVRTPLDVEQLATQGPGRLSKMYQFNMNTILRQTGDPMVTVPSVAELKGLMTGAPAASGAVAGPVSTRPGMAAALGIGGGTPQGQPTQMRLSEALRFIQTSGEAAFAGPRTPETVRLRQLWRQGQEEIGASLPSRVTAPNGTTVNIADFYDKAKHEYSVGQGIIGALNSRGDAGGMIFTRSGNKVIFNQAAESGGGTPFQRAMAEISTDIEPSATARAAHRGGAIGTGDSEANALPLWMRSKGLEGIGASIHAAFPRNPQFAGSRQPIQVPPMARTLVGQGAAGSALNTLFPSNKD